MNKGKWNAKLFCNTETDVIADDTSLSCNLPTKLSGIANRVDYKVISLTMPWGK